jgi:hypothetical protein
MAQDESVDPMSDLLEQLGSTERALPVTGLRRG